MLQQRDWDIRLYIYQVFVDTGRPPTINHVASEFAMTETEAQGALQRLHDAHALFLRPGSDDILMANPLAACATDYWATLGDTRLYANCAWDSLGIPAMLGRDACIQVRHPIDRKLIHYSVRDGKLVDESNGVVHFALPFRQWYDDLVYT